jgi:hypothetical protein
MGNRLPSELWIAIIRCVADLERPARYPDFRNDLLECDTSTVRAFSVISKYFYNLCSVVRYEELVFGLEREDQRDIFLRPQAASTVRRVLYAYHDRRHLLSFLSLAAQNLQYLDLHLPVYARHCQILFALPYLSHLLLRCNHFDFDVNEDDIAASNLESLTLRASEIGVYPDEFIDAITRLPRLKKLDLSALFAGYFFNRFLYESKTALQLDSLAIHGPLRTRFHEFHKYLEGHCSNLRTLSIRWGSVIPSIPIALCLPSLRVFQGQKEFATTCVGPILEEMHVTSWTNHILIMERILQILDTSLASCPSIRRLYVQCIGSTGPPVEDILKRFPKLETLHFAVTYPNHIQKHLVSVSCWKAFISSDYTHSLGFDYSLRISTRSLPQITSLHYPTSPNSPLHLSPSLI